MNDRFEMSFKNKALTMWLILMVPTVIIQLYLTLFTDIPRIYPASLPAIPMISYFIWLRVYKKRKRGEQFGMNGHSLLKGCDASEFAQSRIANSL